MDRARLELAEIQGDLESLRRESDHRTADKRNAVLAAAGEVRTVKAMRTDALTAWTAREAQLKALLDDPTKNGMLDFEELRTASKNVAEIAAWNNKDGPPTAGELARARKRIAARTDIRAVAHDAVEASW